MKTIECEKVYYPASVYVWCKGASGELGCHPIFVTTPVKFFLSPEGRFTEQTCRQSECSLCGVKTPYDEKDLGFQDGYVPRECLKSNETIAVDESDAQSRAA